MKPATGLQYRVRDSLHHRPQGFTIVEMLVAVMIVAVLAALVFFAIGQARVRSMDARCLWNLRSTGMAALRYLSDHNGEFPPTKFWYSRLSTLENPGMRDYFGFTSKAKSTSPEYYIDSILTCPKLKADYASRFPFMLNRCYAINLSLVRRDVSLPNDINAPVNPRSFQRLANVASPARMLAFTDGPADMTGNGEFGTVVGMSMVGNSKSSYQLTYPHQGRQHVVYLDGHAESLTEKAFKAPPGQREFWGDPMMPVD